MAGQGLGALTRATGSSEPGSGLLSSSCRRELLGELVLVLTLLCSLLDGSFHKYVICKVSVLHHCGPPSGLAPSKPPGRCRWESWGGSQDACRACWPWVFGVAEQSHAPKSVCPRLLGRRWHQHGAVTDVCPLASRCSVLPCSRWALSRQGMRLSAASALASPGCHPSPITTLRLVFMMVSPPPAQDRPASRGRAFGEQPSPCSRQGHTRSFVLLQPRLGAGNGGAGG